MNVDSRIGRELINFLVFWYPIAVVTGCAVAYSILSINERTSFFGIVTSTICAAGIAGLMIFLMANLTRYGLKKAFGRSITFHMSLLLSMTLLIFSAWIVFMLVVPPESQWAMIPSFIGNVVFLLIPTLLFWVIDCFKLGLRHNTVDMHGVSESGRKEGF